MLTVLACLPAALSHLIASTNNPMTLFADASNRIIHMHYLYALRYRFNKLSPQQAIAATTLDLIKLLHSYDAQPPTETYGVHHGIGLVIS